MRIRSVVNAGSINSFSSFTDSYARQKRGGEFSDYQDRLKPRRRGLPAHQRRNRKAPERVAVRNSDLVAEQHPLRDPKSVESTEAPRDIESMTKMVLEMKRLMEEKERLQRRLSRRTREAEERRGRYGEHSSSRGWRSRDRHRHPDRS